MASRIIIGSVTDDATTGVAAVKLGREYLGLELSPIYAEMSRQRLARAAHPSTYSKAAAPTDAPLFAIGDRQ